MPNDINELDVNDIGLKGIFGDRFHDATCEAQSKPVTEVPKKVSTDTTSTEKVARNHAREAEKAQWNPPKPAPNWMDKLKASAMWGVGFGGLSFLLFYWEQAGLMAESIAVPSIAVCTLLAGWGVGKNAR